MTTTNVENDKTIVRGFMTVTFNDEVGTSQTARFIIPSYSPLHVSDIAEELKKRTTYNGGDFVALSRDSNVHKRVKLQNDTISVRLMSNLTNEEFEDSHGAMKFNQLNEDVCTIVLLMTTTDFKKYYLALPLDNMLYENTSDVVYGLFDLIDANGAVYDIDSSVFTVYGSVNNLLR